MSQFVLVIQLFTWMLWIDSVYTNLLIKPKDVIKIIWDEKDYKDTVRFNCSSDVLEEADFSTRWTYLNTDKIIYERWNIIDSFKNDYECKYHVIHSTNHEHDLIIKHLKPELAGEYECCDKDGFGPDRGTASFMLIERCSTKYSKLVNNETISLLFNIKVSVNGFKYPPKIEFYVITNSTQISNQSFITEKSETNFTLDFNKEDIIIYIATFIKVLDISMDNMLCNNYSFNLQSITTTADNLAISGNVFTIAGSQTPSKNFIAVTKESFVTTAKFYVKASAQMNNICLKSIALAFLLSITVSILQKL